jgi:hypothetical protein
MADAAPVTDHRPPDAVLRVINPLFRGVLTSPLGSRVNGPFAVLEFRGRRTGRTFRIVVGWHDLDGRHLVFTPARWRLNFSDGAPVTVTTGGRRRTGTGTLISDPEAVASAMQGVLDAGTKPRDLGLNIAHGHRVTAADMATTGREMVAVELGAD